MTIPLASDNAPIDSGRYRRILFFFLRIIAHLVWWDVVVGRMPVARGWVQRTRPARWRNWSRHFRGLAVQMGGVMIKLGQFLSSRVDVLPPEITDELKGLQDEVPAEAPERIFAVLRAEIGDWNDHFVAIEQEPLAAASLGQAHRAWLRPAVEGEEGAAVVVKIQRPNIEHLVRTDLAALRVVARWTMRYSPIRRRANVPALMDEFARTLWEELDYQAEAGNAERFAGMYAGSNYVYIPAVYRQHSTRRVIVLENVEAIKIINVDGMDEAGIHAKVVAERLLEAYFQQIFQEGFFHADPHPGNLFVQPRYDLAWGGDPVNGRPFWLTFVDFGMVGRVPDLMGDNLRKLLVSVTQRDARQLTEAYRDLGFFLPGADLDRIAEVQAVMLERIWGRKLLDLARPDPKEVQELGREFRDLLYDFPFQIPQDFIYLGRALGMISGLVSQLDPDINPWYHIEKFAEQVLRQQQTRELNVATVLELIRPYLTTPARLQRMLAQAESGRLRVQLAPDRESVRRQERLEKRVSQLSWSIVGAAGLLSATLVYLERQRRNHSNNMTSDE